MLGVALSLCHHFNWDFWGTIARSMPQLGLLMILVLLPLQMLSPAVPRRAKYAAGVADAIMLTMPTTHFVSLAGLFFIAAQVLSIVWPRVPDPAGDRRRVLSIALLRFRKTVAQWRKHCAGWRLRLITSRLQTAERASVGRAKLKAPRR